MASRRRFSPKTRSQDERMIERLYTKSGKGMVSDTFRVPNDSFGELWNARDHKTEVRGRQGSFLHTIAKIAITPDIITGTLSDALATGVLQDLVEDDVFQVYSWKDFSDTGLLIAKDAEKDYLTAKVMAYDLFKITADTDTGITYLGNLAQPPKDNFYPSDDHILTGKKNGTIITLTNSPDANEHLVGTYFNWGYEGASEEFNGYRDFIVSVEDATHITVKYEGGIVEDVEYNNCFMQGPIYASYYHQQLEKVVIQAEDRLYESEAPLNGWKEIPGIHGTKILQELPLLLAEDRPLEAEGLFHEVKGDLLLSNYNGHYRVVFGTEGSHYFKINEAKPSAKPFNKPVKVWGFKESKSDESIEIVGFPGYNEHNETTAPRGGGKYYINGVIL